MDQALAQAVAAGKRGEVPVGAVIVTSDATILARAANRMEELGDPTAHAEMIAITQAANAVGNKWLYECVIYVTVEPCSMCAGALVLARVKRIWFGAADPKTGACGSVVNIANHNELNHKITVNKGLFSDECAHLLSQFFKNKRKQH